MLTTKRDIELLQLLESFGLKTDVALECIYSRNTFEVEILIDFLNTYGRFFNHSNEANKAKGGVR